MRVLVRPTRWIALGACLVALAAVMPVATAGADPDVVAMSMPADKSTQVGDVHLQMTTGGGDYDKVGFSFSKSKKGTPVALFLEVDAPTSPGVWDYTWDSTMLPNGKYYVTPAAHHPNDVVVHGAPILITTKNPVLTLSPKAPTEGKKMTLRLKNAPPHVNTFQIAQGYMCAGAEPVVTDDDLANRCDTGHFVLSKPYRGTSTSVTIVARRPINTNSGDVDCTTSPCSFAIATNSLLESLPITLKPAS